MTRKDKLEALELECQIRYRQIQDFYLAITRIQSELQILEQKYLKLQSQLKDKPEKITKTRLSKLDKLKKQMKDLGIDNFEEILKLR